MRLRGSDAADMQAAIVEGAGRIRVGRSALPTPAANQVLVRQFVMPAWIHTGSDITFRRLLRVGEEIEVRAVPLEKWERKGHHFLKLHVAYVARGALATEIDHTAIFRVAQR